jgi:DNA repair exonuclease SbcCD ATPase subunit
VEIPVAILWKNILQLSGKSTCKKHLKQMDTVKKQIENLSAKIRDCGEKWNSFRAEYGLNDEGQDKIAFLESLKKSVEELKNAKERKRILLAEKDNINDKCELVLREAGMLAGEIFLTPADLDNYINSLNRDQAQDDGEYPGSSLDGAIKSLENSINETKLKIAALKARIEDAPAESELSRVIEEISCCQEKKEALEFKGASLALASHILKEVALKMQKDYIPELNREMSRMIGIITSGRYSRVSTNDELRINLEVPETEELMTVNRLSGGTIDQVYLCMRLASVNLLDRGREKLPLFLDEPFSQYDEERVRKAFELLKEISKERQIFFFTCREREYELACAAFGETLHRLPLK